MNIINTPLSGVMVIEPRVFHDERGYFFESYNDKEFKKYISSDVSFKQDNQSKSSKGVLRGLHYQEAPFEQGKLVRCVSGEVFDVAVDIRTESPTYGEWFGVVLSGENNKQLWIPPGFAHGFLTLSEHAEFLYKTTEYYSPDHERCIKWDDVDLKIEWPSMDYIISEKDQRGSTFSSLNTKEGV
ncbi:TPA: dTDP-4-dehydrorhamnose 3,5-epimerase [Citrobacter freundii]|jgi:dTDP-4-dehydrorhamnose 3,5-epimerase|uniref:dTDP-4-dehydrorhamnose 3,5-epimerase n=2 Tax=Citrobacter freundii TaxID=546 RepID=A0AAN4EWT8_CITFR|nr:MULTISPECIES: dTDP-4-dehydrorhamnose 3,5-epimerase [Citrobacter]EJT4818132.1 dTDP-4-dehydrorhamnose 3,5-epimerase [Citrobacter freundii]EKA2132860.1 dTDP-4-dehydrorhamnose 3,5-epimerase [Citrobacter freundii]EKU3952775.1 dTDP-4-dehydrorhamnose 3,5-epimerase [Citrobacter freundii]EKU4665525.1 dTDP-4-dehydrorhamnose 3,5-epimerase [Citrobacter freundii]EKV1386734.1 dTDP-4-dehydrorhamnose 3,5-epimerase [Citrobacter freundii]